MQSPTTNGVTNENPHSHFQSEGSRPKNKYGRTPLHLAISGLSVYHPQISIDLINAGSDVNALDGDGNSPLNVLRQRKALKYWGTNEKNIEKMLVERGAIDISTFSSASSRKKTDDRSRVEKNLPQNGSKENRTEENIECANGWRRSRSRASERRASPQQCEGEENHQSIQ